MMLKTKYNNKKYTYIVRHLIIIVIALISS